MSKTKVVYKNEKFFMNEKKKTIVCTIDCEINLLEIEAVQRMLTDHDFRNFITTITSESDFGFYRFKVSGKAKTSDEDVFDENFGKRLAKTRAQENAFRVANALYCEIGNVLNNLVFNDFCTLTEGTEQAFLKCINHENDLICEKFHLNS